MGIGGQWPAVAACCPVESPDEHVEEPHNPNFPHPCIHDVLVSAINVIVIRWFAFHVLNHSHERKDPAKRRPLGWVRGIKLKVSDMNELPLRTVLS